MHISLVINSPDVKTVEQLRAEVERLREAGHTVTPHLTFEGGDARRFAREDAAAGAELVVACGGDGTLNEVVNGLHDHRHLDGGGPVRMGVVPLGTANDFAAGLEIPMEIPAAMRVALEGRVREIDVGLVGERCFLNVSTGGFGAEATEETPDETKRLLGSLAYLITGVRKFVALESSTARFDAGEPIFEGRFLLFAVGNGGRTGGGNWLTPRAELSDGLLDLCIVKEMSRLEFLTLLPELRAGRHVDRPEVVYRQVRELHIESDAELSVNADGEPLTSRSFHYRLCPDRLPLMVP